jgi:yapsin 1
MCSLTVLGSSASSYVKFPVQKFADIINIGTQDVSTVFKRNEVLNTTVINGIGVYVVKMEIGTPPQTVYLQLDTGSSDMIVNNADIAYCKSMSDGSDYASTDNYELTATFTGPRSTTTSPELITLSALIGVNSMQETHLLLRITRLSSMTYTY